MATKVAEMLKVRLLHGEAVQIRKKPTENTEAYLLYLKGRQYWNKRSKDAVYKAMQFFQLAIDSDPNFALAFVRIADCWIVLQNGGFVSIADAAPKAKQAVLTALRLDDKLAEAHAAYGSALSEFEWKWEEAELEFKRAIELNPNYASAHQWYSYNVLRWTRRLDEELAEAYKALELDPLAPVMSHNVGLTLYFREEYEKAIEYFDKALAINPNFLIDYLWRANCYLATSRYDIAIELYEKYLPMVWSETRAKFELVAVYGMAGRLEEAKRTFSEVEKAYGKEEISAIEFAWAYAGLGETDKMFEYLDKAALEKGPGVPFWLIDPVMKKHRSDPRFLAIKAKVGI